MGNQSSQLEKPDLLGNGAQSHDQDQDENHENHDQNRETMSGKNQEKYIGNGSDSSPDSSPDVIQSSDSYDVNPSNSDFAFSSQAFSSQVPPQAPQPQFTKSSTKSNNTNTQRRTNKNNNKNNHNNQIDNNTSYNSANTSPGPGPPPLHTYHTHPFLSHVPRNRSRSRISYPGNSGSPGNPTTNNTDSHHTNSGDSGNKSRKSEKSGKSSKSVNLGGGPSVVIGGSGAGLKPGNDHHQHDAMTGAIDANIANYAINATNQKPDVSNSNEQPPSPVPSSPSLKFEPAEPNPVFSMSASPTPPAPSEFESPSAAATRQILSEAKSDPNVTFSSLQPHDDSEQYDGEQDHIDMDPIPSTTTKLSRRERKARKRRLKEQRARERNLSANELLDPEVDQDVTAATVATPKSSKKRKRKSNRHDESEVLIPQTQDSADVIDPTPDIVPPASKKRKSKHRDKGMRKTRKPTPVETRNRQYHGEPDEDVDIDEAAVSSAGVPESDDNQFGNLVETLYDDHINKQTDNRPNTASTKPDHEESQSHAEFSSDQEEEDPAEHYNVKSDILGEDPAPAVADDESSVPSEPDWVPGGGSSRDKAAPSAEDIDRRSDDLDASGDDVASADANSNSADDDSDQVEVPSSVSVQNERLPFTGSARRTGAKLSTTLPRVKKPVTVLGNTHSKVNDPIIQKIASPAAVAAAASRKKGQQAVAGSSHATPTTKGKQPRITSMMGDGSSTPAAPHSTPLQTPRTSSRHATGPFTQFELQSIDQAVARWRDDHRLTEYEVNELVQSDPRESNSTDFWDTVQATCPDRVRQKVINVCRRRHHNFVARGTWTAEQSEELTRMFDLHGNKYTLIARLINRHPEDVRDRYRNYVICGENRRRRAWSQEEEEQLTEIVHHALEHINQQMSKARGSQRNIRPEDLIDWQLVSQHMNRTRSRQQCMQKWKAITTRREENGIDGMQFSSVEELVEKARAEAESMTHEDRFELVKAIDATGVSAESRIPWVQVRSKTMGGRWTRPALMVAWHRLARLCDDSTWQTSMIPLLTDDLLARYDETKTLDYPDSDDAQLRSEFLKIKHTIDRRVKSLAGGREDDLVIDDDSDDIDMEHIAQDQDERGSIDLGVDGDTIKSRKGKASGKKDEIEDSEPDSRPSNNAKNTPKSKTPKSKTPKSKGPKPRSMDEASSMDEIHDSEPEVEPPKKAKGMPKSKTPKSRGSGSSKKKAKSNVAEGAAPADTPARSAKEMLARGKTRKSKKRFEPPVFSGDSDDAQSSDTNASEVESIPAR